MGIGAPDETKLNDLRGLHRLEKWADLRRGDYDSRLHNRRGVTSTVPKPAQ